MAPSIIALRRSIIDAPATTGAFAATAVASGSVEAPRISGPWLVSGDTVCPPSNGDRVAPFSGSFPRPGSGERRRQITTPTAMVA